MSELTETYGDTNKIDLNVIFIMKLYIYAQGRNTRNDKQNYL